MVGPILKEYIYYYLVFAKLESSPGQYVEAFQYIVAENTNGVLRKFPSWIQGVPMERIYILRGRGPSLSFNMISWISSQNRQFTSFVLIVCLKGVMPHQRSTCKFISIYGTLLE